jgi:hypothetical protein
VPVKVISQSSLFVIAEKSEAEVWASAVENIKKTETNK